MSANYDSMPRADLIAECERLRAEIETHDASFNLRWRADQRAIKCWQEAHPGNDLVWPDHADMVVWLMDECERMRHDLDRYSSSVQLMSRAQEVADQIESDIAEIERLRASNAALLALPRQYASECLECKGTGLVTIFDYDGQGSDADDQPCPECAGHADRTDRHVRRESRMSFTDGKPCDKCGGSGWVPACDGPHGFDEPCGCATPSLCDDCPPVGYPTDETRCTECPRRSP